MSIRNYLLTEASFSSSSLGKVIKSIAKVLEKKLGTKMYPMGGRDNWEKFSRSGGNGLGVRYICDDGRMVRFNWESHVKSSTITSVDVWYKSKDIGKPDASLKLPSDINIVGVLDTVSRFIKNPTAGQITEAVKITPEKQAEAAKWGVDVTLPMVQFRKEVAARKKQLKAVKGTPEENELMKEIEAAQKQFDNKMYADPDVIFDDLDDLATMVIMGHSPSLLITGMAGIGKTYIVSKLAKDLLGPAGGKWIMFKGKVSTFALYKIFFAHRNKLIIFDDADSVFASEDSVNILKNALDSYDTRLLSYESKGVTKDVTRMAPDEIQEVIEAADEALEKGDSKVELPSRFEFTGRVIFISNIHQDKMDSAIKSRSFTIDVTLKATDVIKRMESILDDIGGDAPRSDKQEVLEYLKEEAKDSSREINMRTFVLSMKVKASGAKRWQHLVSNYT